MVVIKNYRIWFETFPFSFGAFVPSGNPNPAIVVKGMTEEGILIEAYTAADALEQAKIEIPFLLRDLPGAPYQYAIYKIRPEREVERPMKVNYDVPDGPTIVASGTISMNRHECPHLPPCDGQCEGFPIESPA